MIVIFRWWFFIGGAGLWLFLLGCLESVLSLECSAVPSPVELRDLENGVSWPQPFVKIGKHHALYHATATREHSGRIRRVMFPIASLENEYVASWERLRTRYGRREDVPPGEIPKLDTVRVVVIVEPDSEVGREALRGESHDEPELVGVVSSFTRLTRDEREEAQVALDRSNVDEVLVVEAGRAPLAGVLCIAYILAGALLLGWAARLYRRQTGLTAPRSRAPGAPVEPPPLPRAPVGPPPLPK